MDIKKKIMKAGKSLIICLLCLFNIMPQSVYAVTYTTGSKHHDTWWLADPSTGRRDKHEAELLVNGETVFCIDAFTPFKGKVDMKLGSWSDVGIKDELAKELSLIAYFGTKVSGRTSKDWYAITQGLIWKVRHEADGHTDMCYVETPTNPDYKTTVKHWNEILKDVEEYKKQASFKGKTFEMNSNETLTLTDTNNSLSNMIVKSTGGLDVSINGNNQLIIKGNQDADDTATIVLQRNIKTEETGTSLVFFNGKDQSLAKFKIKDPMQISLKVKVNKNGSLKLTKYNDDKSATVPNTTFRITGPNGFDKTLTTDENGQIHLTDLLLGTYKAVETQSANGYLINVNEFDFEIKPSETTSLEVTNDEPKGTITIKKVNELGDKINGATFNVVADEVITNKAGTKTYYQKGDVADTVTISNGGECSTKELPLGRYKVIETKAPDGYLLNSKEQLVTLKYKDQNTSLVYESVSFENKEPTGEIILKKSIDTSKTDGLQGDAVLEGNSYQLYAKDRITNKTGTKVYYEKDQMISEKKTDINGKIEWDKLPLGNYYIKELKSNDTLFLNKDVIDVSIEYQDQSVSKVLVEKETEDRVNMQKIQVFKSGEKDGISGLVKGLQGAEFTFKLYSEVNHVGWDNAKTYAVITTDKDGLANTPYLPHGTYLVKETKTPKDYITAPDFTISVTDDYTEYKDIEQIKRVNINNRPFTSQVKLVKVDKETGKTVTLNSASFKIKDSDGNYVVQKVFGMKFDTFTTNSKNQITAIFGDKGEITLPLSLDAGTYTIEEIKVPEGFLELEKPVQFTITNQHDYDVDEDKEPLLTVKVANERPKGKIILTKTDKETGEPMQDVEYELTAKEDIINPIDGSKVFSKGDVVCHSVTDSAGKITIDDLFMGHYELRETLTNGGYVLSETVHDVVLKQEDTTTKEYVMNVTESNIAPVGKIDIVKTDKDTGELLSGVVFELTAKEDIYSLDGRHTLIYEAGDTVSKDIAQDGLYMTNELGEIHISDLPLGQYQLKEVQTLEGYYTNDTVYDIDLSYDHSDKTVYFKDVNVQNEQSAVEITKVDATDSKELEGAKLTLRDKDGNIVEEWVSGKEAHIIRGLKVNEQYVLHEDLAPIGYATSSDVTFTVKDNGEVTKVTMKDEITKIDISKVDATTSKELEGAHLSLKDEEGNLIEKWVSSKEPHRITGLTAGKTYVLHEDLAPLGYQTASDIEFTVMDTGEVQKVIMKDELKSTIVKTGDDTDIWTLVTLVGASALLGISIVYRIKRKKDE